MTPTTPAPLATLSTLSTLAATLAITLLGACATDPGGDASASSDTATTTTTTSSPTSSPTEGDTEGDSKTTSGVSMSGFSGTATTGDSTDTDPDTDTDTDTDGLPATCDLWTQDCPEGHKCTVWANDGGLSWNSTKCVPLDPNPVGPGEPCNTGGTGPTSGEDNCDGTSMCWNVDLETDQGECVAFCTGSPMDPLCPPEPVATCYIAAASPLSLCLQLCDPLDPPDPLFTECDGGELCVPLNSDWICTPDASEGEGTHGTPCAMLNACNPGLVCIAGSYVAGCEADGCCAPVCDLQEPNTCPGDLEECLPWYEEGQVPAGYENLGVCGIPQ